MKSCVLLAVALLVAAALANRYVPFGRNLIFYSDDVAEFTLSNGQAVRTNKWYFRGDLLAETREFYISVNGLGIMDPEVEGDVVTASNGEGFAVIACFSEGAQYLDIDRTHTTFTGSTFGGTPVGGKYVRPKGYDEYWVSQRSAGDSN